MCLNDPVCVACVRTKLQQQGSQLEEMETQKTECQSETGTKLPEAQRLTDIPFVFHFQHRLADVNALCYS